MSTFTQIKQIHILKNLIGLEEDLYREMLASFGVYSSKNLTETEASIFIDILNEKVATDIECSVNKKVWEVQEKAFMAGFGYACKCLSNGKIELGGGK